MFKDYSVYRPRRRRPRLHFHIPVAVVIAITLAIALFTRPGDAYRHEPVTLTAVALPQSGVAGTGEQGQPTAPAGQGKARAAASADPVSTVSDDGLAAAESPGMPTTNPLGIDADMVTPPASPDLPAPGEPWERVTVAQGQTLSGVFDRLGLPPTEWMALLKLDRAVSQRLKKLRAGDVLNLRHDGSQLSELRLEMDELRTLEVRRGPDGLDAIIETAEVEHRPAFAYGDIQSSLFLSGKSAGLSDRLIMSLVEVLGYDIDFALDLREGDRFVVLYDEIYRDGEKLRDGDIQAVEFLNRGRRVQAFRHELADGRASYYRADGEAVRTAFLRNPLDVFRISSHFNPRRRHPVLNTIRAHRGTDYAAPTGTPIRATGDGKVIFAGVRGGYGRTVIIQHGSTYKTLYAHMSRIRVRSGAAVRQGQVIGHVGSSGLATGPHLHFEFLVNDTHRNPLTVPLPRSEPLPRGQLAAFKARAAELQQQIASIQRNQTAQLDSDLATR